MSTETKSAKHKKEKPTPCPSTICPVSVTLEIISGKWKGIILYHLFSGNKRFSELKALIEGVTHRSLTLQLRELEEDGIITRTVFPVIPPHVRFVSFRSHHGTDYQRHVRLGRCLQQTGH